MSESTFFCDRSNFIDSSPNPRSPAAKAMIQCTIEVGCFTATARPSPHSWPLLCKLWGQSIHVISRTASLPGLDPPGTLPNPESRGGLSHGENHRVCSSLSCTSLNSYAISFAILYTVVVRKAPLPFLITLYLKVSHRRSWSESPLPCRVYCRELLLCSVPRGLHCAW